MNAELCDSLFFWFFHALKRSKLKNLNKENHRRYRYLTICQQFVWPTNGISVIEEKIQKSLLILHRGALFRTSLSAASGIGNTDFSDPISKMSKTAARHE